MTELIPHIWGMGFHTYVFIGVACMLGVILGYYVGRRRRSQKTSHHPANLPDSSSALFQGINYLLANDTDQAIEAFTRAVQVNSETIETYVALGNLFRSKGEIDKAVRIRQSILLRPSVDPETKLQALFDLGMDYKRGGLLDRAIATFEEVIRQASHRLDAYVQLEALLEATGDWGRAYELQKKIGKLNNNRVQYILAHLRTEQAKARMEAGDLETAKSYLKKALSLDPHCVDASLQLGELYRLKNKPKKAFQVWRKIIRSSPEWAHLVLEPLEEPEEEARREAQLVEFLTDVSAENLDAAALVALAKCFLRRDRKEEGLQTLKRALQLEPELFEARKILGRALLAEGDIEGAVEQYEDLLAHLQPEGRPYRCRQCGYETERVLWRCPGCQRWDTIQPRHVRVSLP
ncbi:MAG: tetratricopeptide repeat protein [Deltaproteobacteria bacterium]|nr:tetratricopeptide repeat protein [Deltaproteobacteria bacterium]